MIRKGQSTLEFSLVFVITAFLIMGLLALWVWSKGNIGGRGIAFETSRVGAGSRASPGEPATPFHAATPGEPQMLN